MFSNRLPAHAEINALSQAVESVRRAGADIIDLTQSNPTLAGIGYPANLLERLADGSPMSASATRLR